MEVQIRVGGVRRGCGILGDGVIVGAAVDLDVAAVPGEDLGLDAGEVVGDALGELDPVLLSCTGEQLDDEGGAGGDLEAPFPAGLKGDGPRGRGGGLLNAIG